MTRPLKQTVKYFPHECSHGKTVFILEKNHGNDGYATWFKILEQLGASSGHFIDLKLDENVLFLAAKCNISSGLLLTIIELLSTLTAIDTTFWTQNRVIWCQNFVDNIGDAYSRTNSGKPQKPVIANTNEVNVYNNQVNVDINPQTKLKETKGEKTKEEREADKPQSPKFKPPTFDEVFGLCNDKLEAEKFKDYYDANGWMAGRSKIKDWRCTLRNWMRRRQEFKIPAAANSGRNYDEL